MSRDTQFAEWARTLLTRIDNAIEPGRLLERGDLSRQNELSAVLARAGYDLALHVLSETPLIELEDCYITGDIERVMNEHVPDMPKLPE